MNQMQMLGSKSDSQQSDQSKQDGYAPRQGTIGDLHSDLAPYGRPNDDGSESSDLPF